MDEISCAPLQRLHCVQMVTQFILLITMILKGTVLCTIHQMGYSIDVLQNFRDQFNAVPCFRGTSRADVKVWKYDVSANFNLKLNGKPLPDSLVAVNHHLFLKCASLTRKRKEIVVLTSLQICIFGALTLYPKVPSFAQACTFGGG
ncbi:uncharacterized protein G2W53_006958 [Senna tora]|uniref:Uncharacterized protein n=1 Tax=Senna tora TaxID=362788 RepID=A0A834X599_9FABA|nr:uncharacterized protein G2W53_006958 [Senna tora]